MVGNIKADYYQAEAEDENSVIVWYSADRATIFSISAALSKEEIIKVAYRLVCIWRNRPQG